MLLLIFYALFNPSTSGWALKCPVKLITGLQCPGCGMQRFLHALLQGHVCEAVSYNYFLVPVLPYLALFPLRELMPRGKARERLSRVIEHKAVIFAYIAAYVVWFIVRNIYNL